MKGIRMFLAAGMITVLEEDRQAVPRVHRIQCRLRTAPVNVRDALRIVAHHALPLLFAMWRDRQPYEPTRFDAARPQRQAPTAA